ncbi:MAG: hypothetical protein MR889_09385 [Clostridiales bacterium]|nr:hypothetical protein [Clostridiales bacterium]
MEKRTKRNGFRLGILMLCTVMLLFAVMPTGVLASDNILSDAYWKLFGKSGADVFLTEFSGQNGDVWDIDSNYQDKNVIDYEYVMLNSKSGDRFKDVEISISGISFDYYYDEDFSEVADYSVIDELGDIHYGNVNSENGFVMDDDDYSYGYGYDDDDEDEEPKSLCAAYVVEFELSMNGKTYDDTIEVTFIVPEHIFTRQERLEQTADDVMKGILGTNPSKDAVTDDLVLPRLLEDDDYEWYFIDSSWKSSDTSVIANDGTVTRPDYDKNVTLELRVFYAENFIDDDNSYLLDPGPLGDGETFRTITVTVKGTLGEKEPEPEPEPKPEPDPEPEEPDPLPIIMFNSLTFDTNGDTVVSTVRSMQWSTIDLSSYTTEKEGYVFTG